MNGIMKWTTPKERKEIADSHSVYSRQQVNRVIRGESRNYPLLQALMKRAEENKTLEERNSKLLEHAA